MQADHHDLIEQRFHSARTANTGLRLQLSVLAQRAHVLEQRLGMPSPLLPSEDAAISDLMGVDVAVDVAPWQGDMYTLDAHASPQKPERTYSEYEDDVVVTLGAGGGGAAYNGARGGSKQDSKSQAARNKHTSVYTSKHVRAQVARADLNL